MGRGSARELIRSGQRQDLLVSAVPPKKWPEQHGCVLQEPLSARSVDILKPYQYGFVAESGS